MQAIQNYFLLLVLFGFLGTVLSQGTTGGTILPTSSGTTGAGTTSSTDCSSFTYCDQCITSGCGWCELSQTASCVSSEDYCTSVLDGDYVTETTQCLTCTNKEIPDICIYTGAVQTKLVGFCKKWNEPQGVAASSATTTAKCDLSDKCIQATWELGCSLNCRHCNASIPASVVNDKYCQSQCDDFNTACSSEISSGCVKSVAQALCTSDPTLCVPVIKVNFERIFNPASSPPPASNSNSATTVPTGSTAGTSSETTGQPTSSPSTTVNPTSSTSSPVSTSGDSSTTTTTTSSASSLVISSFIIGLSIFIISCF